MPRKKKTHGGARKGAGRKPSEQSVRIRVPVSKLNQVLEIIKPVSAESIKAELSEIAFYFGGWQELRAIVDEMEAAAKVAGAERYYADTQG